MRLTPALFAHAEAAMTALLTFEHPADGALSYYFRQHRELGHADRGFVAEACYATLRRLRSLSARCPDDQPRKLLLAAMYCLRGWNQKQLAPILKDGDAEWLAVAKVLMPMIFFRSAFSSPKISMVLP